jgi:hypothetical protein
MATQTEWVALPTPSGDVAQAVTPGTVTRQWMSPQGVYINEVIVGGGGGGVAPQSIVFTCT